MTPLTHALVTVAQLLDELGGPERFASVQVRNDGSAQVQVYVDGHTEVAELKVLGVLFDVALEYGAPSAKRKERKVSVTAVHDGVTVTFWTYEQVTP